MSIGYVPEHRKSTGMKNLYLSNMKWNGLFVILLIRAAFGRKQHVLIHCLALWHMQNGRLLCGIIWPCFTIDFFIIQM